IGLKLGALGPGADREDDADRAVVAKVVPGPRRQGADAIAEADQVIDMDEQPGQPADETGEFQSAGKMGDAGIPADRRHGPLVDVMEGCALTLHATNVVNNGAGNIAPRLHRGRRVALEQAVPGAWRSRVGDGERAG